MKNTLKEMDEHDPDKNRVLFSAEIDTPLGKMHALASFTGICSLEFVEVNGVPSPRVTQAKKQECPIVLDDNEHIALLKTELGHYFNGRLKTFTVSLDMMGTPFQESVWKELLRIPFGETQSYEQQTKNLGNVKAIRAVASANGKNKIAIVIPCHRVIGKNGRLTGYAGGLKRKRWLLDFEAGGRGNSLFPQNLFNSSHQAIL